MKRREERSVWRECDEGCRGFLLTAAVVTRVLYLIGSAV